MNIAPALSARNPLRYVTGGSYALDTTVEECDGEWLHEGIAAALTAGGPIDAPDLVPTGGLRIVSGRRFFTLIDRA